MSDKNTSKSGVNLDGLEALEGFGDMSFGALIDGPVVKPAAAPVPAEAAEPATPPAPTGEPMMVKLADIEEDEHQLRKRFELDDIRASIRENIAAGRPPFKVPLIVKAHPEKPGKWKLGDGARRLRSGRLEEVEEAPVIVDENFDDFDQVVVNLQRDGNTPAEIADFIDVKLNRDKLTKGEIAKRLGKSPSWVSKHVALINMPEAVRFAYDDSRLNDVEAMYLLVTNYKDHADAIDDLCINGTELISKYAVMALLEALKNPPAPEAPPTDPAGAPPAVDSAGGSGAELQDGDSAAAGTGSDAADAGVRDAGTAGAANDANADQDQQDGAAALAGAAGAGEAQANQADVRPAPAVTQVPPAPATSTSTAKPPADPGKLRKAIVQIRHDDRPGRLLLDRRAAIGLAWIKYDDDGAEVEIDISTASLVGIVEGA